MAAAVALASPLRRILHVPYPRRPRRAISTPYHFFSRGRWHAALAVAAAAGGDAAVKGSVDRNAVEEVRNILDMLMQAERDSQRRDIFHTNFLTPPIIKEAILVIEKLADIKAVAQGGYPQAERCRISVGHPYSMTSNPDVVAALRFTGITREKVGDILLQVHCLPNCSFAGCCGHVTSTLEKVGEVGVSYAQIPLLALEYEPPRTKSFKTVESSLRFDALASAGFKISCTKLASLIRSVKGLILSLRTVNGALPCILVSDRSLLTPVTVPIIRDANIRNDTRLRIFSGMANPSLSQEIASYLGLELGKINIKRFADGEIYVQLQESVRGCDVLICEAGDS